jgi:PPOX class probable F420-dependent enzyme
MLGPLEVRAGEGPGKRALCELTSFCRDGTAVATPVRVVAHDARLYVWTDAQTGKVRQFRGSPDVTLAACTVRGKPARLNDQQA